MVKQRPQIVLARLWSGSAADDAGKAQPPHHRALFGVKLGVGRFAISHHEQIRGPVAPGRVTALDHVGPDLRRQRFQRQTQMRGAGPGCGDPWQHHILERGQRHNGRGFGVEGDHRHEHGLERVRVLPQRRDQRLHPGIDRFDRFALHAAGRIEQHVYQKSSHDRILLYLCRVLPHGRTRFPSRSSTLAQDLSCA